MQMSFDPHSRMVVLVHNGRVIRSTPEKVSAIDASIAQQVQQLMVAPSQYVMVQNTTNARGLRRGRMAA